jgi:hypothetical protein
VPVKITEMMITYFTFLPLDSPFLLRHHTSHSLSLLCPVLPSLLFPFHSLPPPPLYFYWLSGSIFNFHIRFTFYFPLLSRALFLINQYSNFQIEQKIKNENRSGNTSDSEGKNENNIETEDKERIQGAEIKDNKGGSWDEKGPTPKSLMPPIDPRVPSLMSVIEDVLSTLSATADTLERGSLTNCTPFFPSSFTSPSSPPSSSCVGADEVHGEWSC